MKKQIIAAISTHPIRAAFLLILPFLLGPPMHQALGQGNAGKRSLAANMSQVAPPSTGAITGTYAPAKPAPNIPAIGQPLSAIGQSQLPTLSSGAAGANPDRTLRTPVYPQPCNSKIYDIAGFGASGVTNTTRIYDIGTNTWTTGAACPASLSDLATAYWNGKIYVAGGYNGSGATNTLYIYDIASNTWSNGPNMPTAVYLPGFGIINGKLYVASGNSGGGEVPNLQVYDIASNTWSTGTPVPTPVTGPGSAVYQGKLYLFGGAAPFPTTTTITQIYDPVSNTWSSGPNMNVNRLWFYRGAVDNTSIVAPGGDQSPGIPINDNEQLTATWAIKAPLPFPARGPFAVSDGTVVYIGGGYDGSTVHADLLRYDPVANTYTPLASSPDVHYLSQAVLVPCNGPPCTPGWSAGASLPSVGVRSVGVYFPANGKFYAMGGRSSDAAGSDFTHPFEYDPVANTWTTKSATFTDNQVNNMACGVLTLSGTPYIYCVGGSAAGQAVATARVFYYNPVADSLTYLTAADNWPGDAGGTILPGGFAVTGNKLYILGGFNINVASTNGIYQFDPTAAIGSKWTTSAAVTPEGIMYAPTCAIGGIIYVGGASDFSGGTVIDTTNSFSFNPGTNTTGAIAPIPRATGETRALAYNGKMSVMGGGRVAPNPSSEVDAYDPSTNTWAVNNPVPAFMTARRNFPTDTDGTQHIWLAGGYAPSTPTDSTEVFCQGAAPMVTSAVSRKTHGVAGSFDINMPLTGTSGVECRSGGATHDYSLVVTFSGNVTVTGSPQSQVTMGSGCVGSGGTCDPNGTVSVSGSIVTVPLTNIADVQVINVRINGVNGASDEPAVDVNIPMGILIGDVNGSRAVNSTDVALTKSQVGQPVSGSNFREDVNTSGTITATDVTIVKSDVGHALPP